MALVDFLRRRAPLPVPVAPPVDRSRLLDERAALVRARADSFENAIAGLGTATDSGGQTRIRIGALLTTNELAAAYSDGLYGRLVEMMPFWSTLRGWRLTGDVPEDIAAKVRERYRDLGLTTLLPQVLTMGEALGEARLWLVTEDPMPLEFRLAPEVVRRVRAAHVLVPQELRPLEWDRDPGSPTYRRPLRYEVRPHMPGGFVGGGTVHATRLLRTFGQEVPTAEDRRQVPGLWAGSARAIGQRWWDALSSMETATLGARRALVELSVAVFTLSEPSLIQDQLAGAGGGLLSRLAEMVQQKSVRGALTLFNGETFDRKNINIAGFDQLTAWAKDTLALVTGRPIALAYGQAPSGLSSDQGSWWANWEAQVTAYQAERVRPVLEIILACLLAEQGYRGQWGVEFLPLAETTPTALAAIRASVTAADVAAIGAGILTPEEARSRYTGDGFAVELPPFESPADEDVAALVAQVLAGQGQGQAAEVQADEAEPVGAEALAAQMTEHGVTRCEHGSLNRCRLCGVERTRSLVLGEDGRPALGEDGAQQWAIGWKPIEAPPRADALSSEFRRARYKVPSGANGNARKVLAWKEEHGADVKGMTATGWARARQLASDDTVTGQDLIEMAAWFARHGATAATRKVAAEYESEPWRDAGWVSWLGWGGDTGKTWAQETVERARADSQPGAAWVGLALSSAGQQAHAELREVAESITGPLWGDERGGAGDDPHLTLLYLGKVAPDVLPEVVQVVREVVSAGPPIALPVMGLGSFESDGARPVVPRVPVVARIGSWEVRELADHLTRRLAHLVTARQHPEYVPHVTLGFAPALTPDQIAGLAEVFGQDEDSRPSLGVSAEVQVRYGGEVVASVVLS